MADLLIMIFKPATLYTNNDNHSLLIFLAFYTKKAALHTITVHKSV